MSELFRGGNSRLLARQLDLLRWPVVVLDQRQQIVFASGALCESLQVPAAELVGLNCSAALTGDQSPQPTLAMMLAPPSEVLHGKAAMRQVPWPPHQPLGFAAQAFIPLIDDDPSSGLILVLFGEPKMLRDRLLPLAPMIAPRGSAADEVLLKLRAQWQNLDGLWPLLGSSPAIKLAMRRSQLVCQSSESVFVHGPSGVGKSELVRALATLRSRTSDPSGILTQIVPIDCQLVTEPALTSALDTLAARLRPGASPKSAHLILERVDLMTVDTADILLGWLDEYGAGVSVLATAENDAGSIRTRAGVIGSLVPLLSTVEIELPCLATRREDVPAQVQHHLSAAAARAGRRLPGIAAATFELLQAYSWPGNVVEVRQVAAEMLSNAVLTATILPSHLPLQLRTYAGTLTAARPATVDPISLDEVLLDLERVLLERAIKLSPRNRARAARLLGISRPRFLRRIAQLGLDDKQTSEEE